MSSADAIALKQEDSVGGFSISSMGGGIFGTTGIGIQMDGKVRIGLSDTLTQDDISGVGSFINQVSPDDLQNAREIHRLLCENKGHKADLSKRSDYAIQYSATCFNGQQRTVVQGPLFDVSTEIYQPAFQFFRHVVDTYVRGSRADVKLDVVVDSVVRQKDRLLVSIKLVNSGEYPMDTRVPRKWDEPYGLWIVCEAPEKDAKWTVQLSGLPLFNESEYPEETVTIPPRRSVTYQFLIVPDKIMKMGTYRFNASVVMGISSDKFPVSSMGTVDFHSDYKNPHRVIFDREYPSTPQEWKDFETRKAKEVSFLMPGATVAEPGYYRAASVAGTRDQFVRKLEQGAAAPDLDFQRWDRWEWEADPARATICKPGETCPREGRWILRAKDYSYGSKGDLIYPQHQRRFRMSEQVPTFDIANVDRSRLFWEWLSA